MKKVRGIVLYVLITALLLLVNSTTASAFPVTWWVNGNGYTGLLLYRTNPSTGRIKGTLLGTPVEGYIVERHIVLHRYPQGKRQLWEGWIMDRRLGASIPSYKKDYFIAGTISVNGDQVYPWFGIEKGKTGGVPGINNTTNTQNNYPSANGSAPDISGDWKWFDGETINIYPNGTAKSSYGNKGKWQANWNGSGFTYTINWNNGQYMDSLVLHGDTLDGHNQNGTHVWGKRILKTIPISTNIASILPGVWSWTCCGGSYTGTFKILNVDADGRFSGKFGSSPADGNSPFSGRIAGDRIQFIRTILVNGRKVGEQQWTARVVFLQGQWRMNEGDWTGYTRAPGNGGFSATKVPSSS